MISNAGTRSAGTCSSVMQSAEPIQVTTEPSQNDFDVEHGLQLPTAKKKKLIPVASRYVWLKKDLSTGGYLCTSCIDAYSRGLLLLHPSSKDSWVLKLMLKIDNVQQKAEKHKISQQHQDAVPC